MNHKDFGDFLLGNQLVDLVLYLSISVHRPTRMVVVQSMQKVNDGIATTLLSVAWRQIDRKLAVLVQGGAGEGAELNSCATCQLDRTPFYPAAVTGAAILLGGQRK